MPGRIRADVVAAVKERTSLEDVVREHVTLRSGGVGSLKGLCPFHDEKSPSFNVRPQLGVWHCFGCDEGGDVISFVQKIDHLTFADAVERLADRVGVAVEYEEGGGRPREEVGRRTRLLEAGRVAEEFYAEQLARTPEAVKGRQFLAERGFDRAAAARFGVGYAPRSGEALTRHLRGRGFTDDELMLVGLSGRGQRGAYDRFRGRLVWPIRDITGDCVGFGARRLYDDDRIEAKYLNTSETPLFKKSQVLYGLDLAKKAVATSRQAVVVEGYTDVMACHLAGVDTAVATCGTAFGSDHIKVVRRIMRDDDEVHPAEVVFTFDGDAAGRKAALRAFAEDQRFVSQTYVAVEPDGMDPCDLRVQRGDEAVRDLVARRVPLFEFAITTTIGRFDLDTAEGRVQALRAAAPVVAQIKDRSLRPEYARRLAGLVGIDVEEARRAVAAAGSRAAASAGNGAPGRRSGGSGAGNGPCGIGQGGNGHGGNGQGRTEHGGNGQRGRGPGGSAHGGTGHGGTGHGGNGYGGNGYGGDGHGATGHGGTGYGGGNRPGGAARPGGPDGWPGADASNSPNGRTEPAGPDGPVGPPPLPRPDLRDPVIAAERQLLQLVLQAPHAVHQVEFDALGDDAFTAPLHRAVHRAVRSAGGLANADQPGEKWLELVSTSVPDEVRPYVTDLAVASLPLPDEQGLARLGSSLQVDIAHRDLVRREAEVHSRMQRLDAAGDAVGYMAALREAQVLVERRAALRELRD